MGRGEIMKHMLVERPKWWEYSLHDEPLYIQLYDYLKGYVLEVKYFIQRGLYGYSSKDFWNAEDHLSYLIVEACGYLRVQKKGIPTKYKTWREWDRVLAQIQKGFSLYQKYKYDDWRGKKWKKELHMSFKLLEDNFESLWD